MLNPKERLIEIANIIDNERFFQLSGSPGEERAIILQDTLAQRIADELREMAEVVKHG